MENIQDIPGSELRERVTGALLGLALAGPEELGQPFPIQISPAVPMLLVAWGPYVLHNEN